MRSKQGARLALFETNLTSPIDKTVLVFDIHGCRLPKTARAENPDVAGSFHSPACFFNHGNAISHIATESDEGLLQRLARPRRAGWLFCKIKLSIFNNVAAESAGA